MAFMTYYALYRSLLFCAAMIALLAPAALPSFMASVAWGLAALVFGVAAWLFMRTEFFRMLLVTAGIMAVMAIIEPLMGATLFSFVVAVACFIALFYYAVHGCMLLWHERHPWTPRPIHFWQHH
jgi:hypothetical protein